jgi:methylated-DNA-protein-cysteine methyltransferase-like protein
MPRRALDYEEAIRRVIRQIPRGKVATYGQVAAEAGFPGYHRHVAQVLRRAHGSLPWQRVLGSGGVIRVPREDVQEQRLLLEMEGVRFRGRRVAMEEFQWEGL